MIKRDAPDGSIPHKSPSCVVNSYDATAQNCLVILFRAGSKSVKDWHKSQTGVLALSEWPVPAAYVNIDGN
jgi:hypothetical protein